MEKIIDYRLFDPRRDTLFKSKANEKSVFQTISCSMWQDCQAYKNNQCTMFGMFKQKCPYGTKKREVGFTKRAHKLGSWIKSKKELVKDINQLNKINSKIFNCGDYIYFDFPHWPLAFEGSEYEGSFFKDVSYIKKKDFNIDFLYKIINCRPLALMGGVITSYQKEVVPNMLLSLKANMPEFTNELISKYTDVKDRLDNISLIGKLVLATTIKEGSMYYFDRYGKAIWDGTYFIFDDYKSAFMAIKGDVSAKIKPNKTEQLKIQDLSQVDDRTIFI